MEVDTKSEVNEHEALLLGDGGDETEHTEFSSGDVELLLGDDDVNAFASESFDSTSNKDQTGAAGDSGENGAVEKVEQGQPIEGHYTRGRGGRPFRSRGHYGPPPPGYYPRGLRPPFPGAVPRFGRHPPPFAFRGRPPMGYMRYPRGMFMRPPRGAMRGQFHPVLGEEEEEEDDKDEDVNMSKSEEENSDSGGSAGPKSLMAIKIKKDVKETVKAEILSKAPRLMAPLGMGLGPRFHLRGPRPSTDSTETTETSHPTRGGRGGRGMPHSTASTGLLPTPPVHERLGGEYRGRGRGGRGMDHSSRGSLKRSLPGSQHEGPRAKMMAHSSQYSYVRPGYNPPRSGSSASAGSGYHNGTSSNPGSASSIGGAGSGASARSNLRQIQTVDEPMQTAPPSHAPQHHQQSYHSVPPPTLSHQSHSQRGHPHERGNRGRGRGSFVVTHTPAPSLTQIATVDNSRQHQAPAAGNSFNETLH